MSGSEINKCSGNKDRPHFFFFLRLIVVCKRKPQGNAFVPVCPALSYTGSALRTDLSIFVLCIMGFSRFWLTMADKEIKVHRRVIRIFSMIQRVKNDRSVRTALPVYDNGLPCGRDI